MCCRKTNQFQSVLGYRKQRTHKNIYKSKKQKKSVAMATPVASYRYKTNQLQSMQGCGMLRTPQKILKPKKHEKVLPRQNLLPDIAKKAITHKLSCH